MTLPNTKCTCCGPVTCVIDITGKDDVANWTQVSGTWTNAASGIQTSSANAVAVFNTAHPNGLSTSAIRWNLTRPTSGKVRVAWAYQDIDNYLFVEYEVMAADCGAGAGLGAFVRLGHRTGGADTLLEQYNTNSSNVATSTTTASCYNGATISAQGVIDGGVTGFDNPGNMDSPLTGTWGDKVAFITIGITGTARFRLLDFYGRNDSSCLTCKPACPLCYGTVAEQESSPREVSVFFSGVTNAACGSCVASYDGMTFILPYIDESATPDVDCEVHATRGCIFWLDGFACKAPPNDWVRYRVRYTLGSTNRLEVIGDGVFDYTITDESCSEVLIATGGNVGIPQQCDWSAATAEITPNMA